MIIPADGGNTFKNTDHFLGSPIEIGDYSSGWTTVKIYDVGGHKFIFFLKKSGYGLEESNVHIHELNEYGNIVHRPAIYKKWTEGWTTAEFFKINGKTYLFLLKELGTASDGNNALIHSVKDNGDIVQNAIFGARWTQGWTIANIFNAGGKNYIFFLKKNDAGSDGNNVHINEINNDGTIRHPWRHSYKWTQNWTSAEFYYISGKTFLFLLKKEGTGSDGNNIHIHEMNADGSVGRRVNSHLWDEGWSHAKFFYVYGSLFLLMSKIENGNAHFYQIKNDGNIGSTIATYIHDYNYLKEWHKGYASLEFFSTNGENCFLYLMNSDTGLHKTFHIIPKTDAGPLVSYAGEREAIVWVGVVGGSPELRLNNYTLKYRKKAQLLGAFQNLNITSNNHIGSQDYFTSGIFRLNVEPDSEFEYELYYAGNLQSTGKFFTPPASGTSNRFMVNFSSCMSLHYGRFQQAWKHIKEQFPKFVILLGDNVYSNSTARSMIWNEHLQQRGVQNFAKLIKDVQVLATWDDHDFGPDNSKGAKMPHSRRKESKNTFLELFPNPLINTNDSEGINFCYTWGQVDFIFLDCRYFRGEPHDEPLIGNAQMVWLETKLTSSNAKIKVIISGTTINIPTCDSWVRHHPTEWNALKKLLIDFPNTFIVSGDIHRSKIMNHQITHDGRTRNLTEVISSGVAQNIGEADHPAGYVNILFDTTRLTPKAEISVHYKDGTLKETRTINLKKKELTIHF